MKTTLAAAAAATLLLAAVTAASQAQQPPADATAPTQPEAVPDGQESSKAADVESEAPEMRRLAGSYTLVGNQADSRAKVNKAIDAAISGMGLKKSFARKRLEKVNKPVVRLKISSVGKSATVGMDDYVVTAPIDGGTTEVKTPNGETARASFKMDRAALVQDLVQTNGRRESVFRFNSDGNLVMQVQESSPELTAPVSYSLVYKRAGQ